ncbi:hypothetical protein BI364_10030 [Acidihalobacter yilgarnensis]|uniref:Uncharacterized protein n=2 Tax=Acidihalobacter yilgarnensis TaxID=2819280 RepID=A0A1D8IP66_9GAMM|nr:hypothetical protein BI364_10030 [Acidihalobacter yilgarnensis]
MCVVHDDGSETFGDHNWTDVSSCKCPRCGYEATVAEFSDETYAVLSPEKKMRRFVESIADLPLWEWDCDQGRPTAECEGPDGGYIESHQALMNYIEAARLLLKEIGDV